MYFVVRHFRLRSRSISPAGTGGVFRTDPQRVAFNIPMDFAVMLVAEDQVVNILRGHGVIPSLLSELRNMPQMSV